MNKRMYKKSGLRSLDKGVQSLDKGVQSLDSGVQSLDKGVQYLGDDGIPSNFMGSPKQTARMFMSAGMVLGIAMVGFGIIAFVIQYFANANVPQNNSAVLSKQCDDLTKKGQLDTARILLEKEENARGLTPDLSNKLDSIYLKLAQNESAAGDKSKAAQLLKQIPAESAQYGSAQLLLLRCTSVAPTKTKSAKVAPTIKHKKASSWKHLKKHGHN